MSLEDDPLDLIFFQGSKNLSLGVCAICGKPSMGIDIDSLPKCRICYSRD